MHIKKLRQSRSCLNAAIIPKDFARITVKHWIKNSAGRFHNPPRITDIHKHGFSLKFKCLSSQIALRIHHDYFFEILVSDSDENGWDMLVNFDLAAQQDGVGNHYCALCEDGHRRLYSTRRELWEEHSLKPALAWVNEHLHPEHWICLFGKPAGSRYAQLVTPDELPACRHAENFYSAFRVGNERKNRQTDSGWPPPTTRPTSRNP